MTNQQQPGYGLPPPPRRARASAVDPTQDKIARREEEFRRFLISVVAPAFLELRSRFRAEGREVRLAQAASRATPAEASIAIYHDGDPEFAYALRATISPDRVIVVKRRPVLYRDAPTARPELEERPLLDPYLDDRDVTRITRADIVADVRADYAALRRSASSS